ncbi:O-antigen ligase family protein [Novosphingobium sp.]|uniref:O-antigen ligase family protein n=1 Tax=Novosphingobium sp. TaxID=1874826 RepID=UPI0038BA5E8D
MIFGGSGTTTQPIYELVIEITVAAIYAAIVLNGVLMNQLAQVDRRMWLLAFLIVLVPAAQLVPLPPAIWHGLPGRTIEVEALTLLGKQDAWMPVSMTPARTLASLLSMACTAAVMIIIAALKPAARNYVCAAIAVVAFASIILGVLQVSDRYGVAWAFYQNAAPGFLNGFEANRNAQTEVLKIGMLAAGVVMTTLGVRVAVGYGTWLWLGALIGILSIFSLAVVLTGSRTGMVLLPLALVGFAAILFPELKRRLAHPWRTLTFSAVGVGAIGALSVLSPTVSRILTRFLSLSDARNDIWTDTLFAIHGVWPIGGGMGSFPTLFNAAEQLETVDQLQAGRAHSDWLEWTLETGLPGQIVLAIALALVLYMLVTSARTAAAERDNARRAQTIFGAVTLIMIGLHAIDDYPMRSITLATLAGVAVAFFSAPHRRSSATDDAEH